MKAIASIKLDDNKAEQVRQSTTQAVSELQGLPSASMQVIGPASLVPSTFALVPHTLGRKPSIIIPGIVTGAATAGITQLIPSSSSGHTYDETKYIGVQTLSYSATVTQSFVVL